MGGHTPEEIRQETRKYVLVFAALAVLTIVTVAISYLELSTGPAVFLALLVAVIKGSMVAAYFMHLIDEQKTIYAILILTAVFFVFLMGLPAGTIADGIGEPTAVATEHAEAAEH